MTNGMNIMSKKPIIGVPTLGVGYRNYDKEWAEGGPRVWEDKGEYESCELWVSFLLADWKRLKMKAGEPLE